LSFAQCGLKSHAKVLISLCARDRVEVPIGSYRCGVI